MLACVRLAVGGRIFSVALDRSEPETGTHFGLAAAYFATPFLLVSSGVVELLVLKEISGWLLVVSTVWVFVLVLIGHRQKVPAVELLAGVVLGVVFGPLPLMMIGGRNVGMLLRDIAACFGASPPQ